MPRLAHRSVPGGLFSRFFVPAQAYTVSRKAGGGVTVYWDVAVLWNFALDYLLLLGTLRLAGQGIRRSRVAAAAALGAAYAVAVLAVPWLMWALLPVLGVMCRIAFGRAQIGRLTLLFLLLSCALGGGVLLLGRLGGSIRRLAAGMLYAQVPWGVFCAAAGATYLLLSLVFRGSARHNAPDFACVRVSYGGRTVALRLLRDTGNTLCDPLTGAGVPVIEAAALAPLFAEGKTGSAAYIPFTTLRIHTAGGGESSLRAFRCDALSEGGRMLGARLIALAPEPFAMGYQGLWFAEAEAENRCASIANDSSDSRRVRLVGKTAEDGEEEKKHEHRTTLGKAPRVAGAAGIFAVGRSLLYWRERHTAAAGDAGTGSGTAGEA